MIIAPLEKFQILPLINFNIFGTDFFITNFLILSLAIFFSVIFVIFLNCAKNFHFFYVPIEFVFYFAKFVNLVGVRLFNDLMTGHYLILKFFSLSKNIILSKSRSNINSVLTKNYKKYIVKFITKLNKKTLLLNFNKFRFFSAGSKKASNNLNFPNVYHGILLGYSYGHLKIEDYLQNNFLVIHNQNYFVNISLWYQNREEVLNILNSTNFQRVLKLHSEKFGSQGYSWDLVGSLWVHPILCCYFLPKNNKKLRIKILGFSEFEQTYEDLYAIFPSNYFDLNKKIFLIKKSNVTFQIPQMEFLMIEFLRYKLEFYLWNSLNFKYAFFYFTSVAEEGPFANRTKVYCGVVKEYSSNLKKRLDNLKKYYSNMKLIGIVKFNTNFDNVLYDFEQSVLNELTKISKPFQKKLFFETDITCFPNISVEKLMSVVKKEYLLNSHTCAECPNQFIEAFNNSSNLNKKM